MYAAKQRVRDWALHSEHHVSVYHVCYRSQHSCTVAKIWAQWLHSWWSKAQSAHIETKVQLVQNAESKARLAHNAEMKAHMAHIESGVLLACTASGEHTASGVQSAHTESGVQSEHTESKAQLEHTESVARAERASFAAGQAVVLLCLCEL
jgi:hypothetical protein